jgi:hypothetical protein
MLGPQEIELKILVSLWDSAVMNVFPLLATKAPSA